MGFKGCFQGIKKALKWAILVGLGSFGVYS
nr:MAG TPA: hypothetical protein [Caudoviricetes sp.]